MFFLLSPNGKRIQESRKIQHLTKPKNGSPPHEENCSTGWDSPALGKKKTPSEAQGNHFFSSPNLSENLQIWNLGKIIVKSVISSVGQDGKIEGLKT